MLDILIECDPSDENIRTALSRLFSVAPTEIWIVRNRSTLDVRTSLGKYVGRHLHRRIRLQCYRDWLRGDVLTRLDLVVYDRRLSQQFTRSRDLDVAAGLSELLGCACLVGVKGSPGRALLARDRQRIHAASLDLSRESDGNYSVAYDGVFLLSWRFTEDEILDAFRALLGADCGRMCGDSSPPILVSCQMVSGPFSL